MDKRQEVQIVDFLKQYKPDASEVALDRPIAELEINSIDLVSLVCDLEEQYGVDVDMGNIDMSRTLRGFVVERFLEKR